MPADLVELRDGTKGAAGMGAISKGKHNEWERLITRDRDGRKPLVLA